MSDISRSIVKLDHEKKARGETVYMADIPMDGALYGRTLRSDRARAKILAIRVPALPEGYVVADWRDVPGKNGVVIIGDDTPVFAAETVEFVGDPIGMVAGPDLAEVERILSEIEVEYEDLAPVLDPEESETVFYAYGYEKGDPDQAFAEADKIYEEILHTGYQEHGYLETQGITAIPLEGGRIKVHGSLQCPYYVQTSLILALGMEKKDIQVVQDMTGGAFGGKEDYPSMLACRVAVTALKAGKPVRVIYDRREDVETTSKRHPLRARYRGAVKDGRVTAMEIDLLYNGGAYTTISMVVTQRGTICCPGVYTVPNLRVKGRTVKTNTVPNGAFRGFGAPQIFFTSEMFMAHIAKDLGLDPVAFKEAHFAKHGDLTSTNGRYHHPVPLVEMSRKLTEASGYWEKRKAYANQSGRYRRGIGISYSYHGAGFTGTGERDKIKAVAALQKNPDGTVEILTAGTEMGQGLHTAFVKIVAKELNLPLERVIIELPDTDRVPDSGPTVASRSVMVVGELLRQAAIRLKAEWKEGELQRFEERFVQPEWQIPFDYENFQGDAYPTYSWGAHCIELEIDTLTGEHKVLGAWGCYDVGTPIDMTTVVGQMEGGFIQGVGYAHMEQMQADARGRIRSVSLSDYTMPTSADIPNLDILIHVEEYPEGPYGAKGAGELPIVGVPGAYVGAVEQAVGAEIRHIPVTMEDTLSTWREVGEA
ncbi:MAG: xanthine dehydrogenase family protein molybdopterin-binding subunit [Oscillospiraceae bacterium]|nr:xanthine dehydrogenase family protein molybdopterin-binding subunit [Oscillospiraceae bacterium]